VVRAAELIAAVTVTGLTATTLTSLFGQPRIFFRMAKDGLFFKLFSTVHPKTKAPLWGTIITGVVAAFIAFIFSLDALSNMISIGTLFAFTTVCCGVVLLRYESPEKQFQNTVAILEAQNNPNNNYAPYNNNNADNASLLQPPNGYNNNNTPVIANISFTTRVGLIINRCRTLGIYISRSAGMLIALYIFPCIGVCVCLRDSDQVNFGVTIMFAILAIIIVFRIWYLPIDKSNLPGAGQFICPAVPFLPMLGIFTNIYLIASLDYMSYIRILIWTVIGFAIYFFYGIHHSRLSQSLNNLAHNNSNQQNSNLSTPINGEGDHH
jgi:amino acid transporter